jgi:transposase
MQPYSLEFRQRIIDSYAEVNTSQRQVAQRFRVALSFVQKILKQYRETGSIEPKERLEQTPKKLNSSQLDILKNLVAANNDATFEAFISQKLVPKLWKGAYVIMDNCSIHKGKEIKALDCCSRS